MSFRFDVRVLVASHRRSLSRSARSRGLMWLAGLALLCCALLPACTAPESDTSPLRKSASVSRYADQVEALRAGIVGDQEMVPLLEELCDDLGPRVVGASDLDDALMWAASNMSRHGHQEVRIEPVSATSAGGGRVSLRLSAPIDGLEIDALPVLGAPGTLPTGVSGPLTLVQSAEDVEQLADVLRGKFLVFVPPAPPSPAAPEPPWRDAARKAAYQGATAFLVSPPTPTGAALVPTLSMDFGDGARLPTVALGREDALRFARWLRRNRSVRARLVVDASAPVQVATGNVVAELRGSSKPDEVVTIMVPYDTWERSCGALQSAAPSVVAMRALTHLRALGESPKRTIRVVLLSGTLLGEQGLTEYVRTHEDEMGEHVAAILLDGGAGQVAVLRLSDDGSDTALVGELDALAERLDSEQAVIVTRGRGTERARILGEAGVRTVELDLTGSSNDVVQGTVADTPDKVTAAHLRHNALVLATTAFVLAQTPGEALR